MSEERFLTVSEIAARLRVTEWTVRRWLQSGRLKGTRLGNRAGWRVAEAELTRFVGDRSNAAPSPNPNPVPDQYG